MLLCSMYKYLISKNSNHLKITDDVNIHVQGVYKSFVPYLKVKKAK